MKTLWGEMTKKSLIQLMVLGVVLIAATATATYWVTDRAGDKAPGEVVGLASGVSSAPGATLNPAQGQPGTLYVYHPEQGFVPVYLTVQGVVPQTAPPNGLTLENGPVPPLSYQDGGSVAEATKKEIVKEKVVRVEHVHRAAASPSGSRKEGSVLGGINKTTKWALIGGALGASGGALMGGRGKHKAANGALVGAAIGTVTGGLLGHSMDNK